MRSAVKSSGYVRETIKKNKRLHKILDSDSANTTENIGLQYTINKLQ